MHRSIHARRLAREALELAPPTGAGGDADGRARAAIAALADRHLARREAVAIDASHGDPGALLASVEADVPTLAVSSGGGLTALADALEGRRLDALHLFCAGTSATLDLGGTTVAPLRPSARDRAALARLAAILAAGRDGVVHLYGSPFGTGGEGRAAARALTRALGVAIAATTDDGTTGDARPDWHLEPAGAAPPAPAGRASASTGRMGPSRSTSEGTAATPGDDRARRVRKAATRAAEASPAAGRSQGAMPDGGPNGGRSPGADPDRSPATKPAEAGGGPCPLKRRSRSEWSDEPPATFALGRDPFSVLATTPPATAALPAASTVTPALPRSHGERGGALRVRPPVAPPPVTGPLDHDADRARPEATGSADRAPSTEAMAHVGSGPPATPPVRVDPPLDPPLNSLPDPPPRGTLALELSGAPGPLDAPARAGLTAAALSLEAWFRAEPAVGERTLLGTPDMPRLVVDGPRLVLAVPTPTGGRLAVADLSRLGIEDAGARLVHAVGTVREDWACLYVEGALAATARLDGPTQDWRVPHRPPRAIAFAGELGLARLYTRALAGREALANHRATRRDGVATAGALWSAGPIDRLAPENGPAVREGDRATPVASTPPRERAAPAHEMVLHGAAEAVPMIVTDASGGNADAAGGCARPAISPSSPEPSTPSPLVPSPHGPRVRRLDATATEPFGSRIARVGAPPSLCVPERVPERLPRKVQPLAAEASETGAGAAAVWSVRADARDLAVSLDALPAPTLREPRPRIRRVGGEGRASETSPETGGDAPAPGITPRTAAPSGDPIEPSADDRARVPVPPSIDGLRADAPGPDLDPAPDAARETTLRVSPGDELRLEVTELAGCALLGAIAHWPVALPDWLSLDGATGVASGIVPARAAGARERVAIAAANRHGATATLAIALHVRAIAIETPAADAAVEATSRTGDDPADPFVAFETAMRTAADALPALRALLRAGVDAGPAAIGGHGPVGEGARRDGMEGRPAASSQSVSHAPSGVGNR